LIYHGWSLILIIWPRECLSASSTVKFLPPVFPYCILLKEVILQPRLKEDGSMSIFLTAECLKTLFGVFLHRRVVYWPSLIYVFNHSSMA
jgi:hypothetical protein